MKNHRILKKGVSICRTAAGMVLSLLFFWGTGGCFQKSIRFSEHLIADRYAYAYGIVAADLDGDGDLDLTSSDCINYRTGETPYSLYWFENDGLGRFQRHYIQKNEPERLERHAIGDTDNDGRPDVVIVENKFGSILWFQNSGNPRSDERWQRHVVTTDLPGAYDVALVDLDGDGDLDVSGTGWRLGNEIAWFENAGASGEEPWKKHTIDSNVVEARNIRAGDLDSDGEPDLLVTGTGAKTVLWYENSGRPASAPWKRHIIDAVSPRPMHGEPVDIDKDGDLDVVLALGLPANLNDPEFKQKLGVPTDQDRMHTHQVVWYENDGNPAAAQWKKHIIDRDFPDGFEAVAGDLDRDGDIDVAATSWRTPGRVVWLENSGDPREKWIKHILKDNWISANQVILADFNGDSRPDIAACAEHGSYEVRWWRNEGKMNH